jgi:hypothetical protein
MSRQITAAAAAAAAAAATAATAATAEAGALSGIFSSLCVTLHNVLSYYHAL